MELNKIYNESNLDTMARMPDNFIDLTVTSPPYDNLRTYNGYCFDFENVAKELFRVTKQGGVVVWNVNDQTIKGSETLTSFRQACSMLFLPAKHQSLMNLLWLMSFIRLQAQIFLSHLLLLRIRAFALKMFAIRKI